MRRTLPFALMIALVLLTACGGGRQNEQIFEKTRESFLSAGEIAFTANVRASYGERVEDYTLECTISEGKTIISVTLPQLISGVTATLSDGGAELSFDGLVLDPLAVSESGITPLSAPAFTVAALREGHIISVGGEKHGGVSSVSVSVLDSSDNVQTIQLDPATGLPISAELYSGGCVVVRCVFSDWRLI